METDYATLLRLAIYFEVAWSDYLFDDSLPDRTGQNYPDPRTDRPTPEFFQSAVRLAGKWAEKAHLDVRSICDMGGSTGRAIYEADKIFADLDRIALVEPSKQFCLWARRLLITDASLPAIPIIGSAETPTWSLPVSRPQPLRRADDRLQIVQSTLESFVVQEPYDLVLCLNMLDRHPNPRSTLPYFKRLLAPGGLLVISTPFDFRIESTPEKTNWLTDLTELFGTDDWTILGCDDLYYEYRSFNRCWIRFSTQILGVTLSVS